MASNKRLTQHQVGLILKRLGLYELQSDRDSQLLLSYLTTLYFDYRHTLGELQEHHSEVVSRIDLFFSQQRRAFPRAVDEQMVVTLAERLNRKLQRAPLPALLTTDNKTKFLSNTDWQKFKLWTVYASMTLLMIKFRYVDVNGKSTLMPAVASGLQKVRLAQTSDNHYLTFEYLVISPSLSEFCQGWNSNIEFLTKTMNMMQVEFNQSEAKNRYKDLKNLFSKFWKASPSIPTESFSKISRVRLHHTNVSMGPDAVFRLSRVPDRTRKGLIEGEENTVDRAEVDEYFSIEKSASSQLNRQRLLENKQSAAITNSIIKRENGLTAHTNTLDFEHVIALVNYFDLSQLAQSSYEYGFKRCQSVNELTEVDASDEVLKESDFWILMTLLTGQLPVTISRALETNKGIELDDLKLDVSTAVRLSLRYTITRRPHSHKVAAKNRLVEHISNSLTLEFPASFGRYIEAKFVPAQRYQSCYKFVSEGQIQNRLDEHCRNLQIRRITLRQLSKFMFMFLVRRWPERSQAAAITGMQASEWTPLYYVTLDAAKLQKKHSQFCKSILRRAEQYQLAREFEQLSKSNSFDVRAKQHYGSTLLMKPLVLSAFLKIHSNHVRQMAANVNHSADTLIYLFNAYTVYVAITLKLQTGIRPINGLLETIHQIDFANAEIYLQDKQRRDAASRYLPLSEMLMDQLGAYLQFLKQTSREFKKLGYSEFCRELELVLTGRRQVFNFIEYRKHRGNTFRELVSLSPETLHRYLSGYFPVPLNFNRHILRTWFSQSGESAQLIDDAFGHDIEGQMRLGKFSSHRQIQSKKLAGLLDKFASAISLTPLRIKLPNSFQVDDDFVFTTFRDAASYRTYTEKTGLDRKKADDRSRKNVAKKLVDRYIERHFPELRKHTQGTDLTQKLNDMSSFLKAKTKSLADYDASIRYLARIIDNRNQKGDTKLDLPAVPARVKREVPIRTLTWPTVNSFAKWLYLKLEAKTAAYEHTMSAQEVRASLVLISILYCGEHDSENLLFLLNVKQPAIFACEIAGERHYYIEYVEKNTRFTNDFSAEQACRTRRLFLKPLQLLIIAKIAGDKAECERLDLRNVLPTLQKGSAFKPFQTLLSALTIEPLARCSIDTSRHNVPKWSVALSHVANGTIRSFDMTSEHFRYFINPCFNAVSDEAVPTVGSIDIVRTDEVSNRAEQKKSLGGYAQKFYQAVTRALRYNSKASAINNLEGLRASYNDFDSSRLLLDWLISLLDFKKNAVSTARRYHSAVSLAWLCVTYEIENIVQLSEDEYFELYEAVLEVAHPGEYSSEAGQDEEVVDFDTDKPRKGKQNKQTNQAKDGLAYTTARVKQFHQFLVECHGAPLLTQSIGVSTSLRERIRAGYIPYQLYCAVLSNINRTRCLDYDIKQALYFITIFAYRTGLRASEITSRRMKDVLTTGGECFLYVAQNQYSIVKTYSSRRKIDLGALLSESELQDFKKWLRKRREIKWVNSDLLFCSLDNPKETLTANVLSQSITAWLRLISGRRGFTFHDFRHTALSNLQVILEQDDKLALEITKLPLVQLEQIRKKVLGQESVAFDSYYALATVAGHSSPSTTFHSYLHFSTLLSHRIISSEKTTFSRFLVSLTGAATSKQIARMCAKPASQARTRLRNNLNFATTAAIHSFVEKHYGQCLKTPEPLSMQSLPVAFISTLKVQPSLTEVIKILESYVVEFRMLDGANAREIAAKKVADKFDIDINHLNVYRVKARQVLENKTKFQNFRAISKSDKDNDQFLPRPPQTPAERKLARKVIQQLVEHVTQGHFDWFESLSQYVFVNIYASEPGVRVKKLSIAEWFVAELKPFISLRRWYLYIVCSQKNEASVMELLEDSHPLPSKNTQYKINPKGSTEIYLRLMSPKSNDARKRGADFIASSLIKYVFVMTEIILGGELYIQHENARETQLDD
ncbi:MAG: tyrosine-type recombinase/integrase [Idiomarina sp.]|nr:tyrosine-type recombinase/integrase [Idiomarina sp.]